jgi:hypothetical protein
MGIYLGQLPPAEIARLKAELAETLIANFCYPRFFDHRTESLQMRPVDRAKRQEVWLYLSSVDFTAWSRIDLMSPDIQHQIERLFIQFVQRNRNFFGNQGRRRMADIRLLVSSCSSAVVQGLRNHLTGQKSASAPFGSPRAVVSWATPSISDRTEPSWEQITASTMLLQQQLQEIRGEAKTAAPVAAQVATPVSAGVGAGTTNGSGRRNSATMPPMAHPDTQSGQGELEPAARHSVAPAASSSRTAQKMAPAAEVKSATATASRISQPVETTPKPSIVVPRKIDTFSQPYDSRITVPTHRSSRPVETGSSASNVMVPSSEPATAPTPSARISNGSGNNGTRPSTSSSSIAMSPPSTAQRTGSASLSSANSLSAGTINGPREMMAVGEDDVAIFEQMRHQLVIWLRIEAVTAGLEITNQGPPQLLELLRQDAHYDETRLQVVSTLLNLANQVIKTGLVSVLDYKQALMFHLMHTRRQ